MEKTNNKNKNKNIKKGFKWIEMSGIQNVIVTFIYGLMGYFYVLFFYSNNSGVLRKRIESNEMRI